VTQSPTLEQPTLAEEVRVAMALNGGVSLAVWMGGCVTELDCARRAHLNPEPIEGTSTRRVYHTLCKAFRRVLIVDLMSGSSAGGINGALLGAAIRHRLRLHPDFLRDRWLELGDFGSLLHRTSEPNPGALMQGKLFHESLRAAFDSLLAEEDGTKLPPEHSALPELDVSLDVTTTNVVGERREFLDYWERPLVARDYRARFRFRTKADYTAENLAAASRASASFPGAFEPWRVEAPAGDLAGFTGARWVVDGGLLDNAPIEAALELIPTRLADRQVRRYVCYMNAEPPADAGDAPPAGTDDLPLARIGGYVLGLPRKATFVDQLNAIERATRAGTVRSRNTPALDLLTLDLAALEKTAQSLLPSYQQGRHLLSLEELFTDPARARLAHNSLAEGDVLPWLPTTLAAMRDGQWQWGLRPAERVIQFVLDLIRAATQWEPNPDGDGAGPLRVERRQRLFAAMEAVGRHLRGIEDAAACFAQTDPGHGPVSDALQRARAHIESFDPLPALTRVATVLHGVRADLETATGSLGKPLFGDQVDEVTLTQDAFDHFLRRVLAIEVVRRAIAPDDEPLASGQDLRFAQITPYAPGWIFTNRPSAASEGWNTPDQKLTGLALVHFAGFYRRSWRVNDFMWGRLDGATRVVDLLVAPRPSRSARSGRTGPLRGRDPGGRPARGRRWPALT
jgi:patatin-related protein